VYTKELETYVCMDVSSSFIHDCQNLEATKNVLQQVKEQKRGSTKTMRYYGSKRGLTLRELNELQVAKWKKPECRGCRLDEVSHAPVWRRQN
jgi:hypothetical protein